MKAILIYNVPFQKAFAVLSEEQNRKQKKQIFPHKRSCSDWPWECNSENREVISESYSTLDQSFEKDMHYAILLTSIHTSSQIKLVVSSL